MRRFPSVKTVLFCGFAAMAVVLTVPVNPHVASGGVPAQAAVPTLGSVDTTNSNSSGSPNTTQPNLTNSTTQPPAAGQQQPSGLPPKPNTPSATPSPNNTTVPQQRPVDRPESWGYTRAKQSKLRVHVIDGRTHQPVAGAEVVVIETEKRVNTDANGYTPWFDAPVLRNPRYRPFVAELHGQLGVIVYKNGYRDSIHLGIRMHEDIRQQTTVWMYKIGPQDRRIEPVLYQEPYHHIWLIELADRFRQKSQIGEGPERP
jgi:hypothetical protein